MTRRPIHWRYRVRLAHEGLMRPVRRHLFLVWKDIVDFERGDTDADRWYAVEIYAGSPRTGFPDAVLVRASRAWQLTAPPAAAIQGPERANARWTDWDTSGLAGLEAGVAVAQAVLRRWVEGRP